jgi:hypothetical protein
MLHPLRLRWTDVLFRDVHFVLSGVRGRAMSNRCRRVPLRHGLRDRQAFPALRGEAALALGTATGI